METRQQTLKVTDKLGFVYEVTVKYYPNFGHANALYKERIIAQVHQGKMSEPYSDNDLEWERYEDALADWMCACNVDLEPMCKEHFNSNR
jgi:hypothetical protein